MSKLYIYLGIGLCAALIDILPMIVKRLDRNYIVSAFCFWVSCGIIIPQVSIWGIGWFDGVAVACLMLTSLLPLVVRLDKKAIPVMFLMTMILGGCVGYVGEIVNMS